MNNTKEYLRVLLSRVRCSSPTMMRWTADDWERHVKAAAELDDDIRTAVEHPGFERVLVELEDEWMFADCELN